MRVLMKGWQCRIVNIMATQNRSYCKLFMERIIKFLQKNQED